jgi:hypothetical protein
VPLIRFIKSVVKTEMESIFAVVAALLVLFTAMMDSYISVGVVATLLVALVIHEFVRRQEQGKRRPNS